MEFKQGDIVFFHHQEGNKHYVKHGMVDKQFSDAVIIDYLDVKETRTVNGIPIDDLPYIGKWEKLPKGWTWNTALYEIKWDIDAEMKYLKIDITDPSSIKNAYDKGLLVKKSTKFNGVIDTEITKEGYRICKKYPQWTYVPTHTSIRPDKLYLTYTEAKAEVDSIEDEFKRQAALSDYEWSVEQIEKELNHNQFLTDDERKAYKEWLLAMDNVEDIEVRTNGGNIQWKYEKNKRWNNIEYADVMRDWY